MKVKAFSLALIATFTISTLSSAVADEVVVDRQTRVSQIQSRWNPVFDSQYVSLTSLAAKAKLDPTVYKQYTFLLADFLEVRRVIDAALASATGDLEGAYAYAEEETGEFAMTIPELAKSVAKIKTISCVRAKVTKKVSGLAPRCPSGYKKK
jgi:ethanolamine utilization microcompartment shell protein EutL